MVQDPCLDQIPNCESLKNKVCQEIDIEAGESQQNLLLRLSCLEKILAAVCKFILFKCNQANLTEKRKLSLYLILAITNRLYINQFTENLK